jgi:sterol desaturase/sphingolipid hydroxylase (fatty acid hydroxylase superfamily)
MGLRTMARYGFPVVMLGGFNAAAIALLRAGAGRWWLVVLGAAALLLSYTAERVLPYRADWNRDRGDHARDWAHVLGGESLSVAMIAAGAALPPLVPAWTIWPAHWPLLAQWAGALVVLDLGITLAHYASHRYAWLWRFHAVHHSVRRFYGLNGMMKHPVHQVIEALAGALPLLLVGVTPTVMALLAFSVAVQLQMQHSNVDYRLGPFDRWLSLNRAHRFHHLADARLGDVNFGLFLTLWDRLLGTFRWDARRAFGTDDLGIESRADYPVRYLAQLIEPFRGRATAAGLRDSAPVRSDAGTYA